MLTAETWHHNHENIQDHATFTIQDLSAKYSIPVPPDPSYSPDLHLLEFSIRKNKSGTGRKEISDDRGHH
jgi:hypothetical protein